MLYLLQIVEIRHNKGGKIMRMHTNSIKISTTEYVSQIYQPRDISDEALICGNCPYDECVEERSKAPCKCEYLTEKMKENKGKKE